MNPPKKKRNQKIIQLKMAGLSYSEIGKKFGISKQRAHQIIKLAGDKSLAKH